MDSSGLLIRWRSSGWFVSGIVSQVPNERGFAMTPSSRRKAPISSMRARRRSFS